MLLFMSCNIQEVAKDMATSCVCLLTFLAHQSHSSSIAEAEHAGRFISHKDSSHAIAA